MEEPQHQVPRTMEESDVCQGQHYGDARAHAKDQNDISPRKEPGTWHTEEKCFQNPGLKQLSARTSISSQNLKLETKIK